MIDGGVIELDAQISTSSVYFIGCEVRAVIGDDAMWDTITVYDTGYEIYLWSGYGRFNRLDLYPFSEFIHHDQHNFFLWLPPLRGPTMSSPQTAKGQVMGIVCRALGGIWL